MSVFVQFFWSYIEIYIS